MTQPFKLYLGDCLQVLKELSDNSIDSIVTDPPYGLKFMGKKWDCEVPSIEIWQECIRVLKPGGHLLAFAGTRTQHRMACNIEDAGFEIRDMIAWIYGSGFPKSHNLDGEWQGWGTALKPALEPITFARKPLIGTVAQNVNYMEQVQSILMNVVFH
jgi:site-specific DNA-methyltransferase (adenine-specific)